MSIKKFFDKNIQKYDEAKRKAESIEKIKRSLPGTKSAKSENDCRKFATKKEGLELVTGRRLGRSS